MDVSNIWLWIAIPIIASILIAAKGSERYIDEADRGPTRWIKVILAVWAYAAFLTNKLPFEDMDDIDLDIAAGGTPTVGETLLRIILAIPPTASRSSSLA